MPVPIYSKTALSKCIVERLFEIKQTQAWLALQCNTTPSTISLIVQGKRRPSNKTLFGISKTLLLDYDYLACLIAKEQ